MRGLAARLLCALLIVTATGCARQGSKAGDGDWPSYGLDASEQRFSPLEQINNETVGKLGLAWSMDLPVESRALEATPLAIDGTLFFTTTLAVTYAVDASTGKELWRYDPQAGAARPRAMRVANGINRGVAYSDGAIFVGASDGRLIALDAKTGKPRWITQTIEEPDPRKQITGAPRVFNGKVIIGHAGADFGTRGYVTAYDTKTGKQAWRFYTVPGDPAKGFEDKTQEMAAKTWTGEWWRWGGSGTVWNAMTFDPEFNRIYIGVGNSANYNPAQRSPGGGDNLFLSSIVALDADTGAYIWHYQTNPREAWDFKATTDMVLATLNIGGAPRKVLMQAPTNGFFYVLDRTNGKLLSADKISKVTWADHIDLKTGRPVEAPNIRYEKGPVTFWPSPFGVHNWQPMSFSPKTGLMYIPTMKLAATYYASEDDKRRAEASVIGAKRIRFPIGATFQPVKIDPDDGTGALVAWDPVARKARWTVKYATAWNGGTLVTAGGLVFHGAGNGWLHAYDAADGKERWRFYAGNGIIAPPVTYAVKGEQYITLLVGYGGSSPEDVGWRYGRQTPRVLTFKLGGTAKLAKMPGPDYSFRTPDAPPIAVDAAAAARGQVMWNQTCIVCHGSALTPSPNGPDLRESLIARNFDALSDVLQQGTLAELGMPKFDDLSPAEIRDIQAFILKAAATPPTTGALTVAH